MLTPYPQIVEYNEAVQNAGTAFGDPELRQGRVKTNALGLPVVLSGGFALTYMMAAPRRALALRCFHREIPAAEHKYAAIARALKRLHSPYFVGFDFVPDGIRIRGGFYPVLKMDWADGDTLGVWLDRFADDRRALERLREEFAALDAFLEQHGIAHGDIQNGNVIVSPAGLKLVDYDGLYVPGMPLDFACETGHKHFQHPQRTTAHFGPQVDRFSFIAVDLSLAALIADPTLHRRFRRGGETILFCANDFTDPKHSAVFRCLEEHNALRDAAANFAAICAAEAAAVPSLADFRAGRGIPAPASAAAEGGRPAPSSQYIGPCPIIAAEDFTAVNRVVGQRVELVGRVRSVRQGTAQDRRGAEQPCLYVAFSPPRGDGVEVSVWTDTPTPRDLPDDSWIGRWASVVGLVDPPRVEHGFWSNRTRVGISTGNAHEIDLISEQEALFRLARGEHSPAPVASRGLTGGGNRHLVSRLLNSGRSTAAAARPSPAPAWRPNRSNLAIVGALRRTVPSPAAAPVSSRSPRTAATFIAPRPAMAAAPPPQPAPAAAPRQPVRAAMPRRGSFVIHPRNRRPPPPAPAAVPPNPWQRILLFLGIDQA